MARHEVPLFLLGPSRKNEYWIATRLAALAKTTEGLILASVFHPPAFGDISNIRCNGFSAASRKPSSITISGCTSRKAR